MLRKSLILLIFLIGIDARADVSDYIYPYSHPSFSNYGTLGLLQNPSARFHPEGTLAFSWNRQQPYLRGSILAYPFSWLEASYQYTDVNNKLYSDVAAFSGSQTYKDKSFDFKVRLLKESHYIPAIAVGFRDAAGTSMFASEYVVASKYYRNIDFSAGLGWGVLSNHSYRNILADLDASFKERSLVAGSQGGEFTLGSFFSGPMGIFAGMEIYLPHLRGTRLKIEYDGVNYDLEGFRPEETIDGLPIIQKSKYNLGLVFPATENLHLKLGIIRGNTLNIGFSYTGFYGKKEPFISKNDPPKPVKNSDIVKTITAKDKSLAYKATLKYMNERGLYLQAANIKGSNLEVAYTQSKYESFSRATGRVARVLDQVAPEYIDSFSIINLNADLGLSQIDLPRNQLSQIDTSTGLQILLDRTDFSDIEFIRKNYEFAPASKLPKTIFKISPILRSQIGGPDGFYFGDLRIQSSTETLFSKNLSLIAQISIGIVDTFDDMNPNPDSILPHVRTDIVEYLKKSRSFQIKRLQLNYFSELSPNVYIKGTLGYLEEMFGGYGGEILYRPYERNYGIGAEIFHVAQREYDQRFSFRDYQTVTGHINLYYEEPISEILLQVKGGRFLAKDSGLNIDFSRRFDSGMRVGAFFSSTDISRVEFGEGSFDKGFYFWIPIESFFTKFSRGYTGFGLRPITRDGAALLVHSYNLWGVTDQANINHVTRDWGNFND
jgi:hypothetical protein